VIHHCGAVTTMFIYKRNEDGIAVETEAYFAYYEALASQEEIYLEEREEELRAILLFWRPSPPQKGARRSMSEVKNDAGMTESLNEQLNRAAN